MALTLPVFPGIFAANARIGVTRFTDPPFTQQEIDVYIPRPWLDYNDGAVGTEPPGASRYFFRHRSWLLRLFAKTEWNFTGTRGVGTTAELEDLLFFPNGRIYHVLDSFQFRDQADESVWMVFAGENQSPANVYPAGIFDGFE